MKEKSKPKRDALMEHAAKTHGGESPGAFLKFRHGCNVDLPDHRDLYYNRSLFHAKEIKPGLPAHVDLCKSPNMPKIEDQGDLGSCTAFGTLALFNFVSAMQGAKLQEWSHLFQYYNSRWIEGTVDSDSGATIRDAIKAVVKYGAIPEKELPYKVPTYAHKPSAKCYTDALKHQALTYLRIDNEGSVGATALMTCLAAGYPVVFGATLYESFENPGPQNGVIPMPNKSEAMLGGHCQLIVGYDTASRLFKVRNSWGTGWGAKGYEFMPYSYLTNLDLAEDFWTIRKVEK